LEFYKYVYILALTDLIISPFLKFIALALSPNSVAIPSNCVYSATNANIVLLLFTLRAKSQFHTLYLLTYQFLLIYAYQVIF